jgi:hypothetical protein
VDGEGADRTARQFLRHACLELEIKVSGFRQAWLDVLRVGRGETSTCVLLQVRGNWLLPKIVCPAPRRLDKKRRRIARRSAESRQRWTTQWQAAFPREERIGFSIEFEMGLGLRQVARSCSIWPRRRTCFDQDWRKRRTRRALSASRKSGAVSWPFQCRTVWRMRQAPKLFLYGRR